MNPTFDNRLVLLFLLLFGMATNAAGQKHANDMYADTQCPACPADKPTRDATLLEDSWQKGQNPFKPGNTLKSGEIKCAIVEWDGSTPKPILTVVCPPPEVFTPLRVFLKFSWMEPRDVPKDAAKVVAEPRTGTKIMLDRASIKVFLKISKGADDSGKEKWMGFNALQGFAIIPSESAKPPHQ
jgi:hypothetical protein